MIVVIIVLIVRNRGLRSEVEGPSRIVTVTVSVLVWKSLYRQNCMNSVHENLLAFDTYHI